MKRWICALPVLLCLVMVPAGLSAQQAADTLAIIKVRGSALKVYANADGKERIAKIPVAEIALPLPVLERAETGLLRVQAGSVTGWVKPMGIKTNNMPKMASVCDKTGSEQRVAGARMIGEGCKKN